MLLPAAMKLELLVITPCTLCRKAQEIWEEISRTRHIAFRTVDVADTEGAAIMDRLDLKTVPAILVDGQLKGVGVQSKEQAIAIIDTQIA